MNSQKLAKDEVRHIAKLANLVFSSQELERFSTQLSQILDYVGKLGKVDTSKVSPMGQVTGQQNVNRADTPSQGSLSQEEALSNAPDTYNGFFKIKPILEK